MNDFRQCTVRIVMFQWSSSFNVQSFNWCILWCFILFIKSVNNTT
jgi:hypothetical protein